MAPSPSHALFSQLTIVEMSLRGMTTCAITTTQRVSEPAAVQVLVAGRECGRRARQAGRCADLRWRFGKATTPRLSRSRWPNLGVLPASEHSILDAERLSKNIAVCDRTSAHDLLHCYYCGHINGLSISRRWKMTIHVGLSKLRANCQHWQCASSLLVERQSVDQELISI